MDMDKLVEAVARLAENQEKTNRLLETIIKKMDEESNKDVEEVRCIINGMEGINWKLDEITDKRTEEVRCIINGIEGIRWELEKVTERLGGSAGAGG